MKNNFTNKEVRQIFIDYSQYRNNEEMHNGEDPLEFEDWFTQHSANPFVIKNANKQDPEELNLYSHKAKWIKP